MATRSRSKPPPGRHARPSRSRAGGGGAHAAPAPVTSGAAQRNQAASRQVGSGYGSPVVIERPEPVVVNPQKAVAGAPRVLMIEFLACIVLVAAKPFEKVGKDSKFSEGTLGQFAAIMLVFFTLALVGGISPRAQKAVNLFGALVTVGLFFKNTSALATIAKSVNASSKGKGKPSEVQEPGGILPTPTGEEPLPVQITEPSSGA